uniref:Neprilysin n=1 Tax=Centruroides hentzi TaxID=88313 RepID=A0A2I9LPC8_9SCOR
MLLNSMNTSADPCEDFHQFSCGKWIAEHMEGIGTRTLFQAILKLQKDFEESFKLAKEKDDLPTSVKEIIKAFETCVDYEGLDADNKAFVRNKSHQAGGFPLIDKNYRKSLTADWTEIFVKQYKSYLIGFPLMIFVFANPLDSSENIILISQPDLQSDIPPLQKDALYILATEFQSNPNNASILKDIDDILWFREKVTNLSRSLPELMDDPEEYALVTIEELNLLYPEVDWMDFLTDLFEDYLRPGDEITENDKVFLRGKSYIQTIIELFESRKITERMFLNYGGVTLLNELMNYHYVQQSVVNLKLKQESIFSKLDLKWSQCQNLVIKTASPVLDYLLGNYRKEKPLNKEIIDYMNKAMEEMVAQSTWLDEPTKNAVQDKLNLMIPFISLPPWTQDVKELDKYFDGLPKMTSNAFENALNLKQFDHKKGTEFRGKKNDRSKWPRYSQMSGSQVNAFYVPDFNVVIIPAGIQQLPYYHADRPNYMNFGGMGLIYGHEMTHGFDEFGSLKDKYGNLKNWWTDKSKKEFKKRSKCFIDQYNSYRYDGLDITVNGKQTLSENIADNGGIRQAYLGYQKWVKDHGKEKRLPGLEKYSPEQLFFIAFARSWCSSLHPPEVSAKTHELDNHSADQFRVIGSLSNMKEFSEAFNCKPGSRMNPKNKCIIW